jgi:hypothetical protein
LNIDHSTGVTRFEDNDCMTAAFVAVALMLIVATPPLAYAAGRDGTGKPYKCNPQAECLARAKKLQGPAADAARRDCSRMPTSGTCFSPDDTQADRPGRSDPGHEPDRKRR